MNLLLGHPDEVCHWVGMRIPLIRKRIERNPELPPFGLAYGIGVLDGGNRLIAGCVYHNWDPDCQSVEMSFAADTPKWLSRTLIQGLMGYPYDTLGVNRVNACTPRRNREARRFIEKFGFRREGIATDGFGPGDDAVISRLLKREWLATKWAQPRTAE